MPRINITVTETMDADLKVEAQKRGASVAGLIRLYLTEGLVRDMKADPATYTVEIGGDRRSQDDPTDE